MIPIPQTDIVHVRILSAEGCPNTPATISLIEQVSQESRIPIRLETALIQSQEEAEAARFMGSPTVQVNGVDLDPDVRDKTTYGFV